MTKFGAVSYMGEHYHFQGLELVPPMRHEYIPELFVVGSSKDCMEVTHANIVCNLRVTSD
ncbi:hypothetical protein [Paenibacillus hexagrammi]|uniref:hypothetical protein n=1 Tax=Paenibacillus hexagrammi TaxID=2908839 RepID=UPI003312FC62